MAQYVIDNTDSDGTAFDVPGDVSGAPDSYALDNEEKGDQYVWYVHIDNGWEVDADVTMEGSHYLDESMASAAVDGSTETVSSGGVDVFTGTTLHSFIQLRVEPLSDPTSGELTVTFQRRKA